MGEIRFKYINAPYGCFSNFSNHPIIVEGKTYETVEHFYQSKKMKNPEDEEFVRTIPTPKLAASYGRKKEMRDDWETVKESIMEIGLRHKLEQHSFIKRVLLNTKEEEIIEENEKDFYWAIGDGTGLNRLGKLWMKLREELKSGNI